MLTQAPKGTRDMLPQDAHIWQTIEGIMRRRAALAGYREVRTPVFEHTELFLRGVGDTTDIVQKEMYTFKDKGDRSITLKPEGTAGAVRALIENHLFADTLPCKMYYLNTPVFRYEKPQAGRLREHHQFGMECFGGKSPVVEAELISTLLGILGDLGLKGLSVNINSIGCPNCRPKYHAALKEYLSGHVNELCEDCRERLDRNPLRVLDCKVPTCKALVKDAPSMLEYLCDDCREHFEQLQKLLTAREIPFQVDTHIVRGLDYYTKTVFEVMVSRGREGLALCGGGRYDGLVEQLGGPATCAAGFGIGTERIIMELENQGVILPQPPICDIYVANLGEEAREQSFLLCQQLREAGVKAEEDVCGRSLKAQFKYADKIAARYIALVCGDELARGVIKLRNLTTREETEIPCENAAEAIAALL